MTDALLIEFKQEMENIYLEAKKAGYNASRYLSKLRGDDDPIKTAKELIMNTEELGSYGFTKLWDIGRLDLTVEALLMDNPKFQNLFPENVIDKARERLEAYDYWKK